MQIGLVITVFGLFQTTNNFNDIHMCIVQSSTPQMKADLFAVAPML